MKSALAATIGLILSIILIIKKVSPVYSLILGALTGGLLAGWGLENTVTEMISGIKDITPAIIRILAAGVLTGMLVKTGAASSISQAIIKKLGAKPDLSGFSTICHATYSNRSIYRCSRHHHCSHSAHSRKSAQTIQSQIVDSHDWWR